MAKGVDDSKIGEHAAAGRDILEQLAGDAGDGVLGASGGGGEEEGGDRDRGEAAEAGHLVVSLPDPRYLG